MTTEAKIFLITP